MSNSLKQDIINAVGKDRYIQTCKEIARMFEDADNGICSNISVDEDLNIYNVQFDVIGFSNHMNKMVIALNENDAKEIIIKRYGRFNVNINDLYCEQVNIKRGMIFNA